MNENRLRISAEATPTSRLFSLNFWFSQKVFFSILFIALCLSPLLLRFSYLPSQKSTLAFVFNIIIHSIAIWGVILSANFLAELDVEQAIIRYVDQKGFKYLSEIQNLTIRQSTRLRLSDVSTSFVPDNKTSPPLAMIRLFRRICKEAKDRKFESSIYLIQPYREESIDRLNAISNLQKIALRLGILGTFIGLILAISEIASSPLSQISDEGFNTLLRNLFDSLYISFGTSISGLEVAIFIGFLLISLRNKQKDYFREMEDSVVTMLSVVRNSINKDDFLAEFQQVYRVVSELDDRIYDHAQKITNSIKKVEDKVGSQTDQIQLGIHELTNAKSEFDGFLSELSAVQKKFIDETEKVYAIISPNEISQHLRDGIVKSAYSVSERIQETENAITDQTYTIQQGMYRLNETQKEFGAFLNQISNSQRKFIEEIKSAHDLVQIKKMSDELQLTISQSGDNFSRNIKSNLSELSKALIHLNSSLDNHSNLMRQVTYDVATRKNESFLKRFFG